MTIRHLLLLGLLGALSAACSGRDASLTEPSGASSSPNEGTSGAGESGQAEGSSDDLPHINGGQTGGEAGIHCSADVELEPIAFDASTPLGYSPAEIAAGLREAYASTLIYAEGGETELALALSYPGTSFYAADCRRVVLDVTLGFSTTDAALAGSVHGRLFARSPDAATLELDVPADQLDGSYLSTHASTLPEGPISIAFRFEFTADDTHGSISATSNTTDSSQPIGNF
jgi:hypothetical protein